MGEGETTELFHVPEQMAKHWPRAAMPMPPGTGPDGETCGSCEHCYRSGRRNPRKAFYKCDLMRETHGSATDIRLKWEACGRWEPMRAE